MRCSRYWIHVGLRDEERISFCGVRGDVDHTHRVHLYSFVPLFAAEAGNYGIEEEIGLGGRRDTGVGMLRYGRTADPSLGSDDKA